MKGLKRILKKFDYFGIELHFMYDTKEQYYSSTGGFIFLLFSVVSITYIACNVESFINRKNMTLIFYDKKIEQTDEINLRISRLNLDLDSLAMGIPIELTLSLFLA